MRFARYLIRLEKKSITFLFEAVYTVMVLLSMIMYVFSRLDYKKLKYFIGKKRI